MKQALFIILCLCAGCGLKGQTFPRDTISVIMLLSDTTSERFGYGACGMSVHNDTFMIAPSQQESMNAFVWQARGWEIREKHNTSEGAIDPGFTPWAWSDYYKHIAYLDEKKKPLKKSLNVWQTISK